MIKKYKKYLLLILMVLSLLSVIRYFNDLDSWMVDMVSHFPIQYAMLAFVILVICVWEKIVSLAVLAGLLLVINSGALVNSGEPVRDVEKSEMTFMVHSTNVNIFNEDVTMLRAELQKMDADIVLLLEVLPEHIKEMKNLINHFPYHVKYTSLGTHGLGIALFSKFPIVDHNIKKLSEAGNIILKATLEINNKKVVFYGTHSQNPAATPDFPERNEQFLELAHQISATSMPVIVAGDFNATPFSPIFRELIRITGLKDSREGFGWQPSWPTYVPFLLLPIDHILVSTGIRVHNRDTGPYIGSDHYPVFADLSID